MFFLNSSQIDPIHVFNLFRIPLTNNVSFSSQICRISPFSSRLSLSLLSLFRMLANFVKIKLIYSWRSFLVNKEVSLGCLLFKFMARRVSRNHRPYRFIEVVTSDHSLNLNTCMSYFRPVLDWWRHRNYLLCNDFLFLHLLFLSFSQNFTFFCFKRVCIVFDLFSFRAAILV